MYVPLYIHAKHNSIITFSHRIRWGVQMTANCNIILNVTRACIHANWPAQELGKMIYIKYNTENECDTSILIRIRTPSTVH